MASQPTSQPSSHHRKTTIFIILGILAFLLPITFLTWTYLNQKTDRTSITTSSAPTTTTTTPSSIPGLKSDIQDWSTYQSPSCPYQIKYPQNWQLYDQAQNEEASTILISSHPIKDQTPSSYQLRLQIGCSPLNSQTTQQQAIQALADRFTQATLGSLQQTTLNNHPASYRSITTPDQSFTEYYLFPSSQQIIIINTYPQDSIYQDLIEKILSTLTFPS